MDNTDTELVKLLAEDARQSSEKLAQQLNVSAATVRRRLRKLLHSGTARIVAVTDPIKTGFPVTAIMAFDVVAAKLNSALRKLASEPDIIWVSSTTGRFDIIALARFQTTDQLSDFVEKNVSEIDGIRDSETFVCLRMLKTHNAGV